ncbi:MAG TPA: tetratricopeptide repeat protein [Candidatus Eisenbacteria bacterium]|uniref:Tetratricopeptide repeat protein n=1 Tax=Eiseniibacteriota bacterium TaxID=2212470 RepID=A0A7V2F404_UNCEI|nr:tetratricopeptide repeat protein [Candidatus Eisenbacteria bacterium]
MTNRAIVSLLTLLTVIAFCTDAETGPLDRIGDTRLRAYSYDEVTQGAPALLVPSRILYREGLELVEKGDWAGARERFLLASELSGDYPDPLLTLAKNEFLRLDPGFLPHTIEGFQRLASNFYVQAFVLANTALLVTAVSIGTLLLLLVYLLVKYWPLVDHSIREWYSVRCSFPPAGWVGIILAIALVSLRAGIALYIPILLLSVWVSLKLKERIAVSVLLIAVSALSFFAGHSNTFVPAMDPRSVTRRLSLINERGADNELFQLINEIDDARYRSERDYALGTLLYRLEILAEAGNFLLSSVSVDPEFAPAYVNLGNVYFKQGDFEKALAGYQNAISIDPEHILAHYNLGQTYIKKMLFAESSQSLKRANELGIEEYRTMHPSTRFSNMTIYEDGFGPGALWAMAHSEGAGRERVLFSEILQPYLLFPFDRLWILLAGSAIAAFVLGAKVPRSKSVFRCENCDRPACHLCADEELGVRLCRDCASVVDGLSSVKVIEALLRHRRQKVFKAAAKKIRKRTLLFPGAAQIYYGKTFAGACCISLCLAGVMLLLWNGIYFKDPSALERTTPLWQTIAPFAMLLYGVLASIAQKSKKAPKPFWILPPELRDVEKKERKPAKPVEAETYPWETVGV